MPQDADATLLAQGAGFRSLLGDEDLLGLTVLTAAWEAGAAYLDEVDLRGVVMDLRQVAKWINQTCAPLGSSPIALTDVTDRTEFSIQF